MTAQIIDGKALSAQLRTEVAQRAATLTAQGTKPGLAVVLVGDTSDALFYEKLMFEKTDISALRRKLLFGQAWLQPAAPDALEQAA